MKKIRSFSKKKEKLMKKSFEALKFKKFISKFVQLILTKVFLHSKKSKLTLFLNKNSIINDLISQL